MATKLYLHNATTTVGGTLPGATDLSTSTPNPTMTGASTNRVMDTDIGAAEVSQTVATLGQTSLQRIWQRRFISPELDAQTLNFTSAGDVTFAVGCQQSNTNAFFNVTLFYLAIWRPSTGAVVATLVDTPASGLVSGGGNVTTAKQFTVATGTLPSSGTAQAGDVLVLEIWDESMQAMGTSYTGTIYYDGTAEGTSSSASYINFPNDTIAFQGAAAATTPDVGMALTVT